MAILITGKTYVNNDQVTAANLNQAVNSSTFASGAVDGITTQLSGGAIIVRDGGITLAKQASLAANSLIGNATGSSATPTAISCTAAGRTIIAAADAAAQRTALSLGGAALLAVGTTAGTVAAGDDSRITGAAQKASNLSDLTNAATARTNLGLGTAAVEADTKYAHRANNLSDLASAATARTNLGLGTAAVEADTKYAHRTNNLSDLANAGTARTNLGLNTMATQAANSVAITGGSISGITDLAVADGGTGASNAAGARTNLLPSYSGNAGKILAVNVGATDAEWVSAGGGGTVTSVAVSGGTTGLSTSGGPITSAGTITLAGTLAIANGGTGATSAGAALTALGAYPASNPSGFTSNTGTIAGSSGSTDNRLIRADGTGGSTIQTSAVQVDDSGNMDNVANLTASGIINTSSGHYRVAGTQVLGAQQAAEANVSVSTTFFGSDMVDESGLVGAISALENKMNNLLAKLRTHGIIAT